MRKIKYILLSMTLLLGSCDLLDQDAQDVIVIEDFYNTKKELDMAIRGVYGTLADSYLYGNNMLGRMALDGDEGYGSYSTDQGSVIDYVVSSSDTKILNYWRGLYRGINKANLLLENINKAQDIDSISRENIKGQALFLRGYYYYMLVTKFGDVPLVLTFPKSPKPKDVHVARTTSKEVYNRILLDMEEAAELVYDASAYKEGGHVSKSTIWGMLSRVCLSMAGSPLNDISKYDEAAKWSKKVIDTNYHRLNPSYQQIFINYAQDLYDSKESIWEVEFWGNNSGSITTTAGQVGRLNGIANNNTSDSELGYAVGVLRATGVLMDLYKLGDLRKDWNIAPYYYRKNANNPTLTDKVEWSANGHKFQRYCGKYRREYELLKPKSTTATPTNFPLLRYSDVLLMYAEAINQKDNATSQEISDAYEYINKVRRRAYGFDANTANPATDINSATYPRGADLLSFIQDERARELCFENLRKDDLVRWGIFYKKMKAVIPEITPGTSSYVTAALATYNNVTARDVIWPIPSRELGVNPKLKQNYGW